MAILIFGLICIIGIFYLLMHVLAAIAVPFIVIWYARWWIIGAVVLIAVVLFTVMLGMAVYEIRKADKKLKEEERLLNQ